MKHWINKNYKTLIIAAFLVPIITVAIVSITHVTKWYGISNPVSWALYLSVGIEIAALSALAAISANMGNKVYFPFIVVTLIQFIGNIFFAYSFIDISSKSFKDWVDLVSPLLSFMGVEPTDFISHKRFLAFFGGGMLPIISLSFLHMLVKFTEEDRVKEVEEEALEHKIQDNVAHADVADEEARIKLSQRDLEILEAYLLKAKSNDVIKEAVEDHLEQMQKASIKDEEVLNNEEIVERVEDVAAKREQILSEMMQNDQELGLYDEPFDNPLINEKEETYTFAKSVNEIPTEEEEIFDVFVEDYTAPTQEEEEENFSEAVIEEIVEEPVEAPEEVVKYNIDLSVAPEEEFKEINNDTFWRDHVSDDIIEDDDLKKKL